MVGSIGVVVLHVNRAAEMRQRGLEPTLIHAGARKVDGHAFGALPDEVRADIQATVNGLHSIFAKGVGAGRGKRLTADQARATEARVFHGQAAIAAGLADRLGTFEGVLTELQSRRTGTAGRAKGSPSGQAPRQAPSAAPADPKAITTSKMIAPPVFIPQIAPPAKPDRREQNRAIWARAIAKLER